MPDPVDELRDRSGTSYVLIYPDYKYHPDENNTAEESALEAVAHKYLVRLGRLPKEFKTQFLKKHRDILEGALEGHTVTTLRTFVTPDDIQKMIDKQTMDAEVVILIFCGHGSRDGSFITSNGTPVSQSQIAKSITACGFDGTVICVFNCCHANGVDAAGVTAAGWNPCLPFRWIHLYSCGGNESQVSSHAHHVTRVFSRLVDRFDELWVEERVAGFWRGPPTLTMGSTGVAYSGIFPGPASISADVFRAL